MKIRIPLLAIFLSIFIVISLLPPARLVSAQGQSKSNPQAADADKPPARRSTGWFKRPPEAGDFQEVVDLPNLERPDSLSNYLPTGRDLPAFCRAQTRAYDELLSDSARELARYEKGKISDMDPELL